MNSPKMFIGCFGLVWITFWSLGTLAFDCFWLYSCYKQIEGYRFETTQGTVLKSEVEVNNSGEDTSYHPKIEYSFFVDDREFKSTRRRAMDWGGAHNAAKRIVDQYPVDQGVTVYYDPKSPKNSLLTVGLEGFDFFFGTFLTPFNIIMIACWVVAYSIASNRAIGIGVRRWTTDQFQGSVTWLKLDGISWVSPLSIAGVVILATSFVSIFVFGFGFGFNPPIWVAAANFFGCWGAGLGTALWFRSLHRNQKGDLGIDPLREQLLIPRARSLDEFDMIPFKSIQRIEKLAFPSVADSPTKAELSLIYRSESGTEQSHRLGLWSSEPSADRFIAWFERQVRKGEMI